MRFFSNTNVWFAGLALAMIVAFFSLRPIKSKVHRIIAADGLGYYAYLPAKYIYHDQTLSFSWFDEVFNRHYENNLFEKPTDHFMVAYRDKKINKYYPGVSLLQLPFFIISHACAKLCGQPADGFSMPYQLGMGLAALFYTFLGLLFCSKLIYKLYLSRPISIIVPFLIFFGTNLFTYTIFNGCYSHAYSFCVISLAFYHAYLFFNQDRQKMVSLMLTLFFSLLVISIRPLNVILLTGMLYFYKPIGLKSLFENAGNSMLMIFALLLIGLGVYYNFEIIYTQSGSFLMNTYVGEKFYFDDWRHIRDNFFGFQYGILWYVPLIIFAISAVFFTGKNPKILYLLVPVLALIVLYSFWWYWSIITRVIVDCSSMLALLLAFVLTRFQQKDTAFKLVMIFALTCVPFFQLKAYQLRRNILDNNYTYAKTYFKHFFTVGHLNTFPVNPATIIKKWEYYRDFERESGEGITKVKSFEGNQAAILNSENEYACTASYTLPAIFKDDGFKKIRTSFRMFSAREIEDIQLVFKFARHDTDLAYIPFYLNEGIQKNKWQYHEFGRDLPAQARAGDSFKIYFWNPQHKNEAYFDNFKVEFLVTDGSAEITLK